MDITVLKYFRTTARLGNMSRAAQELHISQPTLTVAIKKLEETLGVTLFERSKKGVTLTASGLQIYQYSDQLTELWDEMLREAGTIEKSVRGTIRLGLHPSVARYTLPLFLPQLLKDHPQLNIQLFHDLSRNILNMVRDTQIDVGLVINPEPHNDLIIKEISQDEVTLWKKKGSAIQDTLIYDPNLFQSQTLLKQIQKKGIHYNRKITSSNLEVIEALLLAGAGHAILPKRVISQKTASLEEAHPSLACVKDSLCLVYRPSLKKNITGKVFLTAIANSKL